MKKKILFLFLFLFLIYNVESLSYKETNRQIGEEIYSEVFVDGEIVSKSVKELIKTKDEYIFLKKIFFDEDYENVEVELTLDYGYFFSSLGANPSNYFLYTDGQLIKIKWNFNETKKGEEKVFFAVIEKPIKKANYLTIVLVLIFILILFSTLYFFFSNKKKGVEKFLIDDEKKIINYLKNCEGKEDWQKKIQRELNFSKAKLSRLIRNMEMRGFIKKIPFGNTNKIVLK